MRVYKFIFIFMIFISRVYTTYINGYYELEYAVYKDGEFFWDLRLPRHYLQFRTWTEPLRGISLYSQISARSDTWKIHERLIFLLDRANIRFYRKNWELLLLAKEERHWVESPALQLISPGYTAFGAGGNSHSIRFNFHSPSFLSTVLLTHYIPQIKTEWYGNYLDIFGNSMITKVRFTPLSTLLTTIDIGAIAMNKQELFNVFSSPIGTQFKTSQFNNSILDLYLKIFHKGALFIVEHATGLTGLQAHKKEIGTASAIEIRGLKFYNFLISNRIYNISRDFVNPFSDRYFEGGEIDKLGNYFEVSYLFPGRMMTFSLKGNIFQTSLDRIDIDQTHKGHRIFYFSPQRSNVFWFYSDLYLEFINDLKSRIAYEITSDKAGTFPAGLFELYAETKHIYGRFQVRLKDIGREYPLGYRIIYACELRINILKNLQLYLREVLINGVAIKKLWDSYFIQLRYFVGWDVDLYFEYGNGLDTDRMAYSRIVDDPGIKRQDLIKFFLRTKF